MTNALVTFAVIAWLMQIALGWWQLQRFNRAFESLCQLGTVGVGRSGAGSNLAWYWRWRLMPNNESVAAC